MDRSFLSSRDVVAASRKFVCIRLATYESKKEAEFMETIFLGKGGVLANTVFCILAPDGKTKLVRPGRSPQFAFSSTSRMASEMNRLVQQYPLAAKNALRDAQLPTVKKLDVSLNVAACDNRPLVVTVASGQPELDAINQKLLRKAWSEQFAGQFVYGSTLKKTDLKPLAGAKESSVIMVVEPGAFGVSGKVVAQLDASATEASIQAMLVKAIKDFKPHVKSHRAHIQLGSQLGLEWETAIPETDVDSIRARERRNSR
ncbi:MAG: hypothetical protein OSB47_13395 [Pirellulaceae bacterium]|jgi:hypothetical protein|nr:hypothetical protein [Pirellulaceae bacterium]